MFDPIILNVDGFQITVTPGGPGIGTVSSDLCGPTCIVDADSFLGAMHAIESVVLAHHCAGVDITESKYIQGIADAINACVNHLL